MNRRLAVTVAVACLLVAAPVAWAGVTDQPDGPDPGGAVTGVVGVQGAALDGALSVATLEERLSAARDPADRADVLADALDLASDRTASLEARLAELRTARDNGTLAAGSYDVRAAVLAARARSVSALVERVRTAAEPLDPETRRAANLTAERVGGVADRLQRLVAADTGALVTDSVDRGFYRRVAELAAEYNDDAGQFDLGVLGVHLGGERVTLEVERSDGTTSVVSFRTTENQRVRDLRAGPHPDATVRVTVDESTARRLLSTDAPGAAASQAFLDGAIAVEGVGAYSSLKWTVANAMLGAARVVVGAVGWLASLVP